MINGLTETELYAPIEWQDRSDGYQDILYHTSAEGIARITINRPEVRNAFRPLTVSEMAQALNRAPYCSPAQVTKRFVPAVISAFAVTMAVTRMKRAPTISTCWISSAIFAPAPSRWLPWWRATLSAAATFCI